MGLLAALGTRPWTRAPLLLRRQPAVLLAVAGAAAVLATAAAAPPLFSSTVGTAALQRQLATRCAANVTPYTTATAPLAAGVADDATGERITSGATTTHAYAADDALAAAALADTPLAAGPARRTLLAPAQGEAIDAGGSAAAAADVAAEVALAVVPGGPESVTVLQDAGGAGVLLPDSAAAATRLRAGDRLHLLLGGRTADVRVRGVYRDLTPLSRAELPPAWCQLRGIGYLQTALGNSQPPALVLTDEAGLRALDARLHVPAITTYYDQPVGPGGGAGGGLAGLDLAHAQAVVAGLPPVGARVTAAGARLQGQLPDVVQLSLAVRASVAGATGPVSLAGALVALLLVGGAGAFWLERRRQEVLLLASRGVGPVALGVKAALEMLPSVLVGTAAGWALAVAVVGQVGPSSRIEADVPATAAVRALALGGVGLLLLGIVGGLGGRAVTERVVGRRAGRWRFVPVELVVIVAAVFVASRLRPAGAQVSGGLRVAAIDRQLLAFPLLLLAGTVALALRLLLLGLAGVSGRGGSGGGRVDLPAGWLAARRVLGAPAIAVSLFAAAALPVGVLVYSAGLTAGSRATLAAKTDLYVGSRSEVSVVDTTLGNISLPADFRPEATVVRQLTRATVAGQQVDVHAVQPDSFAAVAGWDPTYSSRSPADLMRRVTLGHPLAAGERLPVVEVGDATAYGDAPTLTLRVNADERQVPLRVVGTARLAPGQRSHPLFLVDARAVAGIGQTEDVAVLSRADTPGLLRALQAAGLQTTFSLDRTAVVGAAAFLPVTWTFGYLQALAALTGLLTLGAVLLHLEVRQRGRAVAYALSRRMGLSRAAHLRSLLVELAAVLVPGGLLGAAVGWVAVVVAHGHLDPTPDLPPGPLLRVPVATVLGLVLTLVAVVLAGGGFAQRRADGTDVAAALRG